DHAARSFGDRLPRVARSHHVDVDAIRAHGVSFGGGQRLERADAHQHGRIERIENVWRREAGDEIDIAAVDDVRGAHLDATQASDRALIKAYEGVEPVDLFAAAAEDLVPRVPHLHACDVIDAVAARHLDLLEQHVDLGAGRLRHDLLGRVLNVPSVRKVD